MDEISRTCETCKSFRPSNHKVFDGACHNMIATLGAVIQTSRISTCKYHELRAPDSSRTPTVKEKP